jgi:hypothetical protein
MTFLVQGFAVISGAQVHRRRTGARTKPWSWSRPLTGYTRPVTVNQSYVPRFLTPNLQITTPVRIARRDIHMNGLKGTSRFPRIIARRTPLTPAVLIVDNFFHDRRRHAAGAGAGGKISWGGHSCRSNPCHIAELSTTHRPGERATSVESACPGVWGDAGPAVGDTPVQGRGLGLVGCEAKGTERNPLKCLSGCRTSS